MKPSQGGLDLLDDPAAQALLVSTEVAHVAYVWTDGTPRCVPLWFHWTGSEIVVCGPADAPRSHAITTGTPVSVTIDGSTWPYQVLLLRGTAAVDVVDGVAPEYRQAAVRYFGPEQGNGWCDQMPSGRRMMRIRMRPTWVGALDFDGMRRLPSALAG